MAARVPDTITDAQMADLRKRARRAAVAHSAETGRRRAACYTQRRKAELS